MNQFIDNHHDSRQQRCVWSTMMLSSVRHLFLHLLLMWEGEHRDILCWHLELKWAAQRWVGETLTSYEMFFEGCW